MQSLMSVKKIVHLHLQHDIEYGKLLGLQACAHQELYNSSECPGQHEQAALQSVPLQLLH